MTHNHPNTKISRLLILSTTLALAASTANATWSILITDTRTGEFVLGSATCLTGFDLARETPLVLTGIGAITAQSSVDTNGRNRMFIRDRLLEGQPLNQILNDLQSFDPGHNNRQYGMITTTGDSLTYSGIQNADWAGGTTGRIEQGRPGPADDIVYAVQGNILSGPNVVDDAVTAILNTDTDLPGKLMAAMLAARQAGGDGRCSCSNANPTGCGSPPPAPFKSAHVGYMIGSRADDTDSIRAFYELPESATSTALTKLAQNQFATSTNDANIHIYNNATNTNDQVAHFNLQQTIQTNLTNLTNLTAADLNNNGLPDLITLTSNQDLAILLQTEPNTFANPINHLGTININTIEPYNAPNLPGTQLLVLNAPPSPSFVLNFNNNQLTLHDEFFPATSISDALTTDLNNDSAPDLLYTSQTQNQLRFTQGNPAGTFPNSPTFSLQTSTSPQKIATADINNDGLTDILVATGSSRVIDTFINTGTPENPTFAPKISSPINANIIDFAVADFNYDSIPDITALTATARSYQLLAGDANGNFTEIARTRLGTPTNAILADLNNDGDQDLITSAANQLLILDNQSDGTIPRRTGFARGNKFMFINIPNQNASAIDPVDQMITKFSDFRATLENKVDAVQTTVTQPPRILIDDPGPTQSIRIQLRDYNKNLLTDPATFTLHFNANNLTPGLPQLVAPGIYDIPLTALTENNAAPGNHQLTIQATNNTDPIAKPITLMPTLTISTTNNLADFNADNALNFSDISLFIAALSSQNPIADLNNDTLFNPDDITIFLNAYKAAP